MWEPTRSLSENQRVTYFRASNNANLGSHSWLASVAHSSWPTLLSSLGSTRLTLAHLSVIFCLVHLAQLSQIGPLSSVISSRLSLARPIWIGPFGLTHYDRLRCLSPLRSVDMVPSTWLGPPWIGSHGSAHFPRPTHSDQPTLRNFFEFRHLRHLRHLPSSLGSGQLDSAHSARSPLGSAQLAQLIWMSALGWAHLAQPTLHQHFRRIDISALCYLGPPPSWRSPNLAPHCVAP